MEGMPIKILGRATLTVFNTSKVDPVTIYKSRETIIFGISGYYRSNKSRSVQRK